MDDPDALLLSRCRDDRERRDLLARSFEKHRRRLRFMIELRLEPRLRARIDPSDVLQEAYLEAAARLDEFLQDPPMPLFLWLRFLAAQRLGHLRAFHLGAKKRSVGREARRPPAPPSFEMSSEAFTERLLRDGTTPSEDAIREEDRRTVRMALETMDPMDREIIALRYFERLTCAQAGVVLGIGEGAARKRSLRALESLRKILEKARDRP